MVHETQKERGASAGFIGSKGEKFAQKLPAQRLLTDTRIKEYKDYLDTLNPDDLSANILKDLKVLETSLAKLKGVRTQITALNIPLKKAIGYYTKMNTQMLNIVPEAANTSPNQELRSLLGAYANFLKSKERAGIERAVLSATFAAKQFAPGMKEKFITLIAAQNSFLDSFLATAPQHIKDYYQKTYQGDAINQVIAMRKQALHGDLSVDPIKQNIHNISNDITETSEQFTDISSSADILINDANDTKEKLENSVEVSAVSVEKTAHSVEKTEALITKMNNIVHVTDENRQASSAVDEVSKTLSEKSAELNRTLEKFTI